MKIRRAEARDAARINELLYQVAKIHADGRPDIFKTATKKYSDGELIKIIECESTPIFVATDGDDITLGYAFCVFKYVRDNILLHDTKMLYIDDICVDEGHRGEHIGRALFSYVEDFAKKEGFDSVSLNVWSFNEAAYAFYKSCGMTEQRTIMEKKLK